MSTNHRLTIISLDTAYQMLYPKLVKSYAMDAILQKSGKPTEPSIDMDMAKAFMDEIIACDQRKHKSIGHGWDYRFNGRPGRWPDLEGARDLGLVDD